jgi:hypothetical protein
MRKIIVYEVAKPFTNSYSDDSLRKHETQINYLIASWSKALTMKEKSTW